ncbi:MAG: ATP synthase F0 subunit B [Enhydrobacter sp.]|nr:ATP synthase F0 subunit B [Enhydrobacter sp.]
MIGSAWAADAAAGSHSLFAEPTFWVAVAFFLFLAIAGKTLWKGITETLDKRTAAIAKALSDAEQLRVDATRAKAEAEQMLAQAATDARDIINQAREESERMQVRAKSDLETAIMRREQQARDRIAQAESAASKQIRDAAVDAALSATRSLLREQAAGPNAQALVDQAISELPRRLH